MAITIGKLKISGAALLALAAAYFFDFGGISVAVVIATVLHEAGHFFALKMFGQRITALEFELWGLNMHCDSRLSYLAEIITAAAGPIVSLLLAVIASYIGRIFDYQEAYVISGVSIVFCAFNILPSVPLDGGKILYAASAWIFGLEKAERIACVMSCAVIMVLLVAGVAILIKTRVNFTLLLTALWLLISYCKRSGVSIKSKRKINGSESWIKS